MVVLPTPPFWFATQMTRVPVRAGMVISPLGFRICTARIASMANGGSSSSRVGVSRETVRGRLGLDPRHAYGLASRPGAIGGRSAGAADTGT